MVVMEGKEEEQVKGEGEGRGGKMSSNKHTQINVTNKKKK